MKKKWSASEIVMVKRLDLIPYERNTRIHPDAQIDQLVQSIKEWGFTVPILIDENMNVISGHGRLYAADKMKLKTVPCIVAQGWTEEQRRAYVIADNKLAEQSIWNDDLLYVEMNELIDGGFDIGLTGWDFKDGSDAYAPNVEPLFAPTESTAQDVDGAAGRMATQIDGITNDKAATAHEVICPYCAAAFKFSGD